MIDLTQLGSREPFFLHLFKGCVLFESLLKENPKKQPTQTTLGNILRQDLFTELGISQTIDTSSNDFDAIVRSLTPSLTVEETIERTGKTRNTLGHNLVWLSTSLDTKNYNLLVETIAVACIHAISTLYK
jgi:hypothetical protein